jgi:uncharacterized cupredoxin-like copper-binding protein
VKKSRIFLILSLLIFPLLSACAGAPVEASNTLTVEMTEFMFDPDDYTVSAGQEITLELSNAGAIEHEFLILKKGVVAQAPFDHDASAADILFQAKLGPGESATFTFTIPEPGEYEVVCALPGHMEAGMVGKLTAK